MVLGQRRFDFDVCHGFGELVDVEGEFCSRFHGLRLRGDEVVEAVADPEACTRLIERDRIMGLPERHRHRFAPDEHQHAFDRSLESGFEITGEDFAATDECLEDALRIAEFLRDFRQRGRDADIVAWSHLEHCRLALSQRKEALYRAAFSRGKFSQLCGKEQGTTILIDYHYVNAMLAHST